VTVRVRYFLIALLATTLLGLALLSLALPERSPVNRAAFERIEEGMTLGEVEQILGGPSGDYRTAPPPHDEGVGDSILLIGGGPPIGGWSFVRHHRRWRGDEIDVMVCFDRSDLVVRTVSEPSMPRTTGPAERILWRLGRLKERCFSLRGRP
jgi:hypothetical protein